VAQSADVLAEQTGLGDAFLGATLLALATALPEVSTTIAASRNGRYSMAISNNVGSNAFCVALLFPAELLYRGGTIMEHVKETIVFVTSTGAILTSITHGACSNDRIERCSESGGTPPPSYWSTREGSPCSILSNNALCPLAMHAASTPSSVTAN
jgi:hypothetical protein